MLPLATHLQARWMPDDPASFVMGVVAMSHKETESVTICGRVYTDPAIVALHNEALAATLTDRGGDIIESIDYAACEVFLCSGEIVSGDYCDHDVRGCSHVHHLVVSWHVLGMPGSRTTNVAVGGGITTEDDIPAIISVAVWGHNRNADLVIVDEITR